MLVRQSAIQRFALRNDPLTGSLQIKANYAHTLTVRWVKSGGPEGIILLCVLGPIRIINELRELTLTIALL